jgi:hypothetical protein
MPRTLHQTLHERKLIKLKDQRTLALSFAYALFQCYGSPYIHEPLQKDSIFFYALTERDFDFGRPFLATQFARLRQLASQQNVSGSLQHPCPSILSLGILLIETHEGRLLGTFRKTRDAAISDANRELFIARREIESLNCTENYRNAVKSCLEVPWVSAGEKVDLWEPENIWGFYEHVIYRLERELALVVEDNFFLNSIGL